jgi:hypothetical protein
MMTVRERATRLNVPSRGTPNSDKSHIPVRFRNFEQYLCSFASLQGCGIWKSPCVSAGWPGSDGPFFGTPPLAEGFNFPSEHNAHIQNPCASYRGFWFNLFI